LDFLNSGTIYWQLGLDSVNTNDFFIMDANANKFLTIIDYGTTGSIGINTTTPSGYYGEKLTVNGGTLLFGSATTTHNFFSLGYASTTNGLFTQSNLRIGGNATTSNSSWIGTGGLANFLDLIGGDLFVQDDLQVAGSFFAQGVSTTTATTTIWGMKVYKNSAESPTTTLEFL
jgi:hypothetical protein